MSKPVIEFDENWNPITEFDWEKLNNSRDCDFVYSQDGKMIFAVDNKSERSVKGYTSFNTSKFSRYLSEAENCFADFKLLRTWIGTRDFVIISEEFANNSYIIVNNEIYNAFEFTKFSSSAFNFHNIDTKEIFNQEIIDECLGEIGEYFEMAEEYKNIVNYREDLIKNGGSGYLNHFNDELENFRVQAFKISNKIAKTANAFTYENYFKYGKSRIKDLSLFNGSRVFVWEDDKYRNHYFNEGKIIEFFGQFWNLSDFN